MITPTAPAGDGDLARRRRSASAIAAKPDRERRSGERPEVLMAEERDLALARALALELAHDAEKLEQPPAGCRHAPGDEDGEEALEVDRAPEEQHDRGASSAYSITFAAVIRWVFGASSGRQKHETTRSASSAAANEPQRPAAAGAAASRSRRRRPPRRAASPRSRRRSRRRRPARPTRAPGSAGAGKREELRPPPRAGGRPRRASGRPRTATILSPLECWVPRCAPESSGDARRQRSARTSRRFSAS